MNDNAVVAGTWQYDVFGATLGYVYHKNTGQFTELTPLPGGASCYVAGINSTNVVCGKRSVGPSETPYTAFTWSAQTGYTDLGMINAHSTACGGITDAGVVAVSLYVDGSYQPALWQNGTTTPLGTLYGSDTSALGISANNILVGSSSFESNQYPYVLAHAFSWNGSMSNLGLLVGDNASGATGVNSGGIVVGSSRYISQTQNNSKAVVWFAGQIRNLNDLVDLPSGITLTDATKISGTGLITCSGKNSQYLAVGVVLRPIFIAGDVNSDCLVNVLDLLQVIMNWGVTQSPADLNHDSIVNVLDLLIVINNWGG